MIHQAIKQRCSGSWWAGSQIIPVLDSALFLLLSAGAFFLCCNHYQSACRQFLRNIKPPYTTESIQKMIQLLITKEKIIL